MTLFQVSFNHVISNQSKDLNGLRQPAYGMAWARKHTFLMARL